MSRQTRYFLVASGLIVVVGLGTGLVAVYNGNLSGATTSRLGDLAYVPSDATAVAFADVRRIMDSEFRQRLSATLPTGEGKDWLLAETGIDVERDIDAVIAGLSPDVLAAGAPVVLLRGRFKTEQIEALAIQHGAIAEDYKGKRLLRAPEGQAIEGAHAGMAHGESGLAFLEPGLVAIGQLAGIRRAIDSAASQDGVATKADLMEFVNEVASTSDAWVAGRVDTMSAHAGWSDDVKEHLGAVEWFALSADVNATVTCRLLAEARDAQSGEQLRSVVNGALSLARMMAAKDARFVGMLDSVRSTGSGAEMELSFTVPPELFNLMANSSGRFAPAVSTAPN